jgi:protein-tyrosine phosphatase
MNWGSRLSLGVAHAPWTWRAGAVLLGKLAVVWAGLAALGIALGYVLNAPGFLLKTPAGRLPAASWLCFWPYHLATRVSLGWYRLRAREAPFHEVVPGLFLGSSLRRKDALELCRGGPLSVLDLTSEFSESEPLRGSGTYRCLPVLDHRAPSQEQLQQGVAFISEQLPHGRVFVHCAVGHGRSATCVAAFLLARGLANTPDEAIALLKSRRPGVRLNAAQRRALTEFLTRLENTHERGDLRRR